MVIVEAERGRDVGIVQRAYLTAFFDLPESDAKVFTARREAKVHCG